MLLSLHMVQERGSGPLALGEWRRRVRSATGRSVSLRLLTELARPWGYSPDFLTPGRGDAGFETQLDRVLSTPRSRLRAEFSTLAGESPATTWTRALGDGEPAALRRLGGALSTYHRIALAPYEGAMRARVEADRARQAAALLDGGVDRLPARLHPRVEWRAPVLHMPVYADQDVHLDGRGLVLVPSYFCRIQPIALLDADQPPVLVHPLPHLLRPLLPDPADDTEGRPPAEPVVALLGRTRAAVLEAAAISAGTTSELARRVGVAPPVVSRQTAVLREAGLLDSARHGGTVVHRATALGIALLNGELPG
ncbi:ArsR/SmtB family transcription factor [Streptomyces roseifaciens]|uniref:ArsR/SmtB family transcription factor n=1 Tax=Streptomyces roseifaciens TaxID=1488406 RepID=UPI000AE5E6C2|nr:winged helix-turn-helix domain-containing protein [Streptomyces roseifaciens]